MRKFLGSVLALSFLTLSVSSMKAQERGRDHDRSRDRDRSYEQSQESLVTSRGGAIRIPETGMTIDALKAVGLDRSSQMVRSVIVIARSDSWRSARLEVLVNGSARHWTNLSRSLEVLQVPVHMACGNDLRSLEIRVDGAASVEQIGVAVEGAGSAGSELTIEETIRGIFVSGPWEASRDTALKDYTERCEKWKAAQTSKLGSKIRYLSCGSINEKRVNGYQYESNARLIIEGASKPAQIEQAIAGVFVAGPWEASRETALADYEWRCGADFKESIVDTRGDILYASCGPLSETGNGRGFQYVSTARLLIDSRVETTRVNDKISGIFVNGPWDSSKQEALIDYTQRCRAWKQDMIRFNQGRALFVSCGTLKETGQGRGYKYESDAVALIRR